MKFQQTRDNTLILNGILVYLLQKRFAVDAVDHRNIRGNVFDFVGLQVSDEMSLDVLGKHFVLGLHLLRLVLAKRPLSGIIKRLYVFHGFEFRDRNQLDMGGQTIFYLVIFFKIHNPNFVQRYDNFPNRSFKAII